MAYQSEVATLQDTCPIDLPGANLSMVYARIAEGAECLMADIARVSVPHYTLIQEE